LPSLLIILYCTALEKTDILIYFVTKHGLCCTNKE